MRTDLFFGLILLSASLFPCFATGEAIAQGCMNGGCHQELLKSKYMHGPVAAEMAGINGCQMCHISSGSKCTPKRGGSYKTKAKGLCSTCHSKGTSTRHSDKEIESKCLKCHNPHGSNISRYMLRTNYK